MALMPKRVKHRKSQRGRIKGNATRGNRVVAWRIRTTNGARWLISAQTIEAGRVAASQYLVPKVACMWADFPHKINYC